MITHALAVGFLVASCAEPPVRVYTNADLERVSPFRGETGALSEPASQLPAADSPRGDEDSARRARDEAYWRREATKVRSRIATLLEQAEDVQALLDAKAQERRTSTRSKGTSSTGTAPLERRLARIRARIGSLEEDLADRARRARALPGWLR